MTAAEQANYDSGVRRAKLFIQSDGIPASFKMSSGYGISWTTQAGVSKSARIAEIDQPMYKEGFMSVITQAMNATGTTSGIPTEVSATNAPAETAGDSYVTGIVNDAVTQAGMSGLPKWIWWVLLAVGGYWLLKKMRIIRR